MIDDLLWHIHEIIAIHSDYGIELGKIWSVVTEFYSQRGFKFDIDQSYKSYLFPFLLQLPDLLVKLESQVITFPAEKDQIPILSSNDKIKFYATEQLSRELLLGDRLWSRDIPDMSWRILKRIAITMKVGVTKAQICKEMCMDPRTLFHFFKPLLEGNLLVKMGVRSSAGFSINVWYYKFSPTLSTMEEGISLEPVKRDEEDLEDMDEDKATTTVNRRALRTKIVNFIKGSSSQVMRVSDILTCVDLPTRDDRYVRRQLHDLVEEGCLERVDVIDDSGKKHRNCFRLVLDYDPSHKELEADAMCDVSQDSGDLEEEGGEYLDVNYLRTQTFEYQITDFILSCQEAGASTVTILDHFNSLLDRCLRKMTKIIEQPQPPSVSHLRAFVVRDLDKNQSINRYFSAEYVPQYTSQQGGSNSKHVHNVSRNDGILPGELVPISDPVLRPGENPLTKVVGSESMALVLRKRTKLPVGNPSPSGQRVRLGRQKRFEHLYFPDGLYWLSKEGRARFKKEVQHGYTTLPPQPVARPISTAKTPAIPEGIKYLTPNEAAELEGKFLQENEAAEAEKQTGQNRTAELEAQTSVPMQRRRGRPRKNISVPETSVLQGGVKQIQDHSNENLQSESSYRVLRSQVTANSDPDLSSQDSLPLKRKRGRPPKNLTAAAIRTSQVGEAQMPENSENHRERESNNQIVSSLGATSSEPNLSSPQSQPMKRKRGRPPKNIPSYTSSRPQDAEIQISDNSVRSFHPESNERVVSSPRAVSPEPSPASESSKPLKRKRVSSPRSTADMENEAQIPDNDPFFHDAENSSMNREEALFATEESHEPMSQGVQASFANRKGVVSASQKSPEAIVHVVNSLSPREELLSVRESQQSMPESPKSGSLVQENLVSTHPESQELILEGESTLNNRRRSRSFANSFRAYPKDTEEVMSESLNRYALEDPEKVSDPTENVAENKKIRTSSTHAPYESLSSPLSSTRNRDNESAPNISTYKRNLTIMKVLEDGGKVMEESDLRTRVQQVYDQEARSRGLPKREVDRKTFQRAFKSLENNKEIQTRVVGFISRVGKATKKVFIIRGDVDQNSSHVKDYIDRVIRVAQNERGSSFNQPSRVLENVQLDNIAEATGRGVQGQVNNRDQSRRKSQISCSSSEAIQLSQSCGWRIGIYPRVQLLHQYLVRSGLTTPTIIHIGGLVLGMPIGVYLRLVVLQPTHLELESYLHSAEYNPNTKMVDLSEDKRILLMSNATFRINQFEMMFVIMETLGIVTAKDVEQYELQFKADINRIFDDSAEEIYSIQNSQEVATYWNELRIKVLDRQYAREKDSLLENASVSQSLTRKLNDQAYKPRVPLIGQATSWSTGWYFSSAQKTFLASLVKHGEDTPLLDQYRLATISQQTKIPYQDIVDFYEPIQRKIDRDRAAKRRKEESQVRAVSRRRREQESSSRTTGRLAEIRSKSYPLRKGIQSQLGDFGIEGQDLELTLANGEIHEAAETWTREMDILLVKYYIILVHKRVFSEDTDVHWEAVVHIFPGITVFDMEKRMKKLKSQCAQFLSEYAGLWKRICTEAQRLNYFSLDEYLSPSFDCTPWIPVLDEYASEVTGILEMTLPDALFANAEEVENCFNIDLRKLKGYSLDSSNKSDLQKAKGLARFSATLETCLGELIEVKPEISDEEFSPIAEIAEASAHMVVCTPEERYNVNEADRFISGIPSAEDAVRKMRMNGVVQSGVVDGKSFRYRYTDRFTKGASRKFQRGFFDGIEDFVENVQDIGNYTLSEADGGMVATILGLICTDNAKLYADCLDDQLKTFCVDDSNAAEVAPIFKLSLVATNMMNEDILRYPKPLHVDEKNIELSPSQMQLFAMISETVDRGITRKELRHMTEYCTESEFCHDIMRIIMAGKIGIYGTTEARYVGLPYNDDWKVPALKYKVPPRIWFDIYGDFLEDRWQQYVQAVLFTISFEPGMTRSALCRRFTGVLNAAHLEEILIVLESAHAIDVKRAETQDEILYATIDTFFTVLK